MVAVQHCRLNCNSTSSVAFMTRFTTSHFWDSQVSNAYCAYNVTAGMGMIEEVKGSPYMAIESTGAHVFCMGQIPTGVRKREANGVIYDSGISTGAGSTQPSVTPEKTASFQATLTKSYQGAWRGDTNDVVQGVFSSNGYNASLSWNYGCLWFGTLKAALAGKTIRSATLTLYRRDGGTAGSTTLWLHGISNTTNSGVCTSNINHGQLGAIARGSTMMYRIPIAAVQRLANGTDGGLCLYESPYSFGSSAYSSNYCRIAGTDGDVKPVLNVVYV